VILAFLDLGPNLTGFTVGDGSVIPLCDVWRFDKVGAEYGKLLLQFEKRLDALFAEHAIEAVGYEAPLLISRGKGKRYGDKLSTLRRVYPLGAFLEWYCLKREIPVSEVLPTAIKREVTGKSYADKELLVVAALQCGVDLPTGDAAKDAADSWGGWLTMLRHYDKAASQKWDALVWSKGRGSLL